jgi:cyanophycinase
MKYIQFIFLSMIAFSGCDTEKKEIDRTPQEINKSESRGPENGTLLIIGGGVSDEIWNKFMELMGGADEHLVVIPTATSSETLDDKFLDNYKSSFIKRGFNNVTVLHSRDQVEANSEPFIEILKTASGVWFSGGRQWRHADSYLNTKTHEAFKKVLKRGGVIAGNSAGATIQGSYLARGDTKANTIMMGDHEEGLGFISNVAIDQHLFARNRQFDMFEILDTRPELLGIGIDEKNTAIVVQRDRFSVIGESYVAIYDGSRWSAERDTIYQLPKGSREFYMLKAGDEYDLKKRKVVTFDDRAFIKITAKQIEKYVGIYQLKDNSLRLEILSENDSLKVIQLWTGDKYSILPESDTRFFVNNSDMSIEFEIVDKEIIDRIYIPSENGIWERVAN